MKPGGGSGPGTMEEPFRKDMANVSWDQVYERQKLRADLAPAWMDALGLKPGSRVLEIGAGPGFFSLLLAERVGPAGIVYAVDRSPEALAFLERRQAERGLAQIRRIAADAAALGPEGLDAQAALATMVLHHADAPAAILRNVAGLLPAGALLLVGEFHPDGPCEQGPPRDWRLDPKRVEAWCAESRLAVASYRRQSPEHYMLLARKAA